MSDSDFKVIVCAAIRNKERKIFIARRAPDKKLGGFWEFPGGKLEHNEELIPALKRELREELEIEIDNIKLLLIKPHTYPHGAVLILFYICDHLSGDIKLVDHDEYLWCNPKDLRNLELLPANEEVIAILESMV